MAQIINLRRARKAKVLAQDARIADANRAKFGTSLAQRRLAKAETQRANTVLDAHQLTTKPNDGG